MGIGIKDINIDNIVKAVDWRLFKAKMVAKTIVGGRYPSKVDNIRTSLSEIEKQLLFELAGMVKEGSVCLEVGSYYGASAACTASGFKADKVKFYCVDTFQNDAVSDEREDVLGTFMENTKEYKETINVLRGYSKDVSVEFNETIDMLFLDGDHSWKGIITDLKCWLPKVHENTILIMHDVFWGDVLKCYNEIILPNQVKKIKKLPNIYAGICDYKKILDVVSRIDV